MQEQTSTAFGPKHQQGMGVWESPAFSYKIRVVTDTRAH